MIMRLGLLILMPSYHHGKEAFLHWTHSGKELIMDYNIKEVSERLRACREALDFTPEYMAERTQVSVEDYLAHENGERDLSLSFMNNCAEALGMELIALLTGQSPKLTKYSIDRKDEGLRIERRERFEYYHLAYMFKNKCLEPMLATAPYLEEQQNAPIKMSSHEGQEFDYIISGQMKFIINGHVEILGPGDALYLDSKNPHGMIAVGGEDCKFIAILVS